ncbi:hypothetical protein CLV25_11253 [Acetobacteroides hydrogenigenes]|uniref:Uncharacterized protein n=1 Tax=Acetobacteroides hydrogenigenes TaxID=979970 RepID=A0A4R2ECD5_9BACT|nr:hypothetical protein CLV25_11253 [Acetobacteroides hydrogenigenes]
MKCNWLLGKLLYFTVDLLVVTYNVIPYAVEMFINYLLSQEKTIKSFLFIKIFSKIVNLKNESF